MLFLPKSRCRNLHLDFGKKVIQHGIYKIYDIDAKIIGKLRNSMKECSSGRVLVVFTRGIWGYHPTRNMSVGDTN